MITMEYDRYETPVSDGDLRDTAFAINSFAHLVETEGKTVARLVYSTENIFLAVALRIAQGKMKPVKMVIGDKEFIVEDAKSAQAISHELTIVQGLHSELFDVYLEQLDTEHYLEGANDDD